MTMTDANKLTDTELIARTGMVEDLVRKKFALTCHPRAPRGQAADSPNIPADVKRIVYLRDRGSCAYVSPDGRRCGSRRFVQFHHVHARAAGGKATVDNVELRCRVHNLYEAEVFFGFGKRYRRDFTRPGTGTAPRAETIRAQDGQTGTGGTIEPSRAPRTDRYAVEPRTGTTTSRNGSSPAGRVPEGPGTSR